MLQCLHLGVMEPTGLFRPYFPIMDFSRLWCVGGRKASSTKVKDTQSLGYRTVTFDSAGLVCCTGRTAAAEQTEMCATSFIIIFCEIYIFGIDVVQWLQKETNHIRYKSNVHSYRSSRAPPKSGTRLLKRAAFPCIRPTERRWNRCWMAFCFSSPVCRA